MKTAVIFSFKHILREVFFYVSLFPIGMLTKRNKPHQLKGFCYRDNLEHCLETKTIEICCNWREKIMCNPLY